LSESRPQRSFPSEASRVTEEQQTFPEGTSPQPQPVAFRIPLYRPIVTWFLLASIAVVFAIETLLGGSTDGDVLIRMGAKVAPLIAAGEYWRLFTSMFLHIGVMHLFFNGYALLVIGTELERLLGPGRFSAIYLLSGLFGSLASYALSDSLAAGASGAIFGIIGALAAFFLVHRQRLGAWGSRRLANIGIVIVFNLVWGFSQPGRIDNLAHVGGLLAGLALGWALAPRYELDRIRTQVVDRNDLQRYWPALGLAVSLLLGGTALVTPIQRDSPLSHLYRGQQAIDAGEWEEAVAEFDQALALDPSLADATIYFHLGLAHSYQAQLEEAINAYQKALELDPALAAPHWNLALTYLEVGRYADARASFEAYAALTPGGGIEVQPYLDELDRLGY
jgi:rhomboid protease GluP